MPTSKGFYSPTLVEYSCTNTVRLLPSHLQILLGLAVPFDLLQSMLGWSFVYQFWQGHSDFGLAFFPSSRVCYQCHLVHADCEITWQSRIKHVHNKSLEHNVTFQKKKNPVTSANERGKITLEQHQVGREEGCRVERSGFEPRKKVLPTFRVQMVWRISNDHVTIGGPVFSENVREPLRTEQTMSVAIPSRGYEKTSHHPWP